MRCAFATYLILLAMGSVADAQHVSIAATGGRTSNHRLRDPRGVSAGVAWPVGNRSLVRVSYHFLGHGDRRVGTTCTGLILDPVTECPQEQISDNGELNGVTLALASPLVRRGNMALSAVPAVSLVHARVRSHGRQTGRTLIGSELMAGIGGGLELSVGAPGRWPAAVHIGAHVGMLAGWGPTPVDGYSPFSDDMRVYRAEVGVSLWKPRRGARVTAHP